MATPFKNRVFGCAIVRSINSNYNADFTHQPRTLPDGTVYATDKVLKYSVRNYLKKVWALDEKLFYFKNFSDEMLPRTLVETYKSVFQKDLPKNEKAKKGAKSTEEGESEEVSSKAKKEIAQDLLSCIDVRLFGGTFAPKGEGDEAKGLNLSIHGPVQFTHGVDAYRKGSIFTEQIMSPFADKKEKKTKDSDETETSTPGMTTLGSQSKLSEGHYVHHISVNPHNLDDLVRLSGGTALQTEDIAKLKSALCHGVTMYDSAAKAGTENELLLWVQLREGSMLVLPSFVNLVKVANDEKRTIDLSKIKEMLSREAVKKEVEKIEIWFDSANTTVVGQPDGAIFHEING